MPANPQPRSQPKPNILSRLAGSASSTPPESPHCDPSQIKCLRDVYWQNVVRDMLNALCVLNQQQPELFDGRFAVLTHSNERIAISKIAPIFAVSLPDSPEDKATSLAVQCTIYRIQTPGGEVFTLPLQEIRALHTLTGELIQHLQQAAEHDEDEDPDERTNPARPFGFAAYAALPKLPASPLTPAPDEPTE